MASLSSRLILITIVLAAALACKPTEPLRIDAIQLGRSLNPDNTVATHSTLFKPSDTVHVSILTPEAGSGNIGVRWMYGGKVIDEPTRSVSYRGGAATSFNLQNGNGLPPGDYSVQVVLDGEPVGTRAFHVK